MKITNTSTVANSLALSLLYLTAGSALAQQSTVQVQLDKPGVKVSPYLYGIFFEEINHAGDGGLYAELIRNRSFEDAAAPQSWASMGNASLQIDETNKLNAANQRSLKVRVAGNAGARAGVFNGGYWGIALKKGQKYTGSLYARRDANFKGALTVSLENTAGRVFASTSLPATSLTNSWKKHSLTLVPNADATGARLVVSTKTAGSFWLDMVSLFPPTFKNRPNGLRPDLAQKVADMAPGFVRFPGGCYVEGANIKNAFRWKTTLGDIAHRPGHLNDVWQYRSTDGLGYHEYLQLCEDVKSAPLFVVNCGMSHQNVIPMNELGPWIQDALDAIEYANGPVTSKWGAVRAKNGHPAPFNLKFIEIGNENGGPAYNERYAAFYDAIKAKYPEIRLVACLWNGRPNSRPIELLDEHYYNTPEFFANNAHRYDSYDRKGPKIYIGEYAVTENAGQGHLAGALGEAAFMTGMERNADIVEMGSYAPLFTHVNDRRWNPDAIFYDSATSAAIPSYYVQKLFARYKSDVAYPTQATTRKVMPMPTGGVGVGTWRTTAEYDDIKVVGKNGATLYQQNFENGAPNWINNGGTWTATDGVYRQTDNGENRMAIFPNQTWGDYTLTMRARKISGNEGFLIAFHARSFDNYYWWNIGGWGNTEHALQKSEGATKIDMQRVRGSIETGRWYDIKVEVMGGKIRCFLNGKLTQEIEDHATQSLFAVGGRKAGGQVIVKVVNTSDEALDSQVVLAGVKKLAPQGEAITLTGNSPQDENSLSQPENVAPFSRPLKGVSSKFRYNFPAHSLTILRMRETS